MRAKDMERDGRARVPWRQPISLGWAIVGNPGGLTRNAPR